MTSRETFSPFHSTAVEAIDTKTRWVPGFPADGIVFADITPVLADAQSFAAIIADMSYGFGPIDMVAGLDARGFLVGAGMAVHLNVGVLALRKGGKLPPPVLSQSYNLEYGQAQLELPAEGIDLKGKRILIADDVLATGGTMAAAVNLLHRAGAIVVGALSLIHI